MTTKISKLLLCTFFFAGCGASPATGEGQLQLQLPKPLTEISGLVEAADGSLLAVADEKAHIYRIDFAAKVVERFTKFGDPVKKGDFEGLALLDEHLFAITSNGVLWSKPLQGDPKNYTKTKTGIGKLCEVEGLAAWSERQLLLVLCKESRAPSTRGRLTVFGWSVPEAKLLEQPVIQVGYRQAGIAELNPSGLSFSANRQQLFIVAARQRSFVELRLDGSVVRAGRLPFPATHPQTEGVVITAANTLYLADEGGDGRGTVTRYEPSF